MNAEKVVNIQTGARVGYKGIVVFVVGKKEDGSLIVAKNENSPHVFSIPAYSPNYHDLLNRVTLV